MRKRSTELDNQQNEPTEMMTFASLTIPDAEENELLKELQKDADATHASINKMVIELV